MFIFLKEIYEYRFKISLRIGGDNMALKDFLGETSEIKIIDFLSENTIPITKQKLVSSLDYQEPLLTKKSQR